MSKFFKILLLSIFSIIISFNFCYAIEESELYGNTSTSSNSILSSSNQLNENNYSQTNENTLNAEYSSNEIQNNSNNISYSNDDVSSIESNDLKSMSGINTNKDEYSCI